MRKVVWTVFDAAERLPVKRFYEIPLYKYKNVDECRAAIALFLEELGDSFISMTGDVLGSGLVTIFYYLETQEKA